MLYFQLLDHPVFSGWFSLLCFPFGRVFKRQIMRLVGTLSKSSFTQQISKKIPELRWRWCVLGRICSNQCDRSHWICVSILNSQDYFFRQATNQVTEHLQWCTPISLCLQSVCMCTHVFALAYSSHKYPESFLLKQYLLYFNQKTSRAKVKSIPISISSVVQKSSVGSLSQVPGLSPYLPGK